MSSTFGDQPGDVVTSSRGDVLEGVSLSLYSSSADATAGTNLLATVVTNLLGRWSYTHATLTVVWVRTLDGQVYLVEDPTVSAAAALASAAASAASAALSASLVGAPADTAVATIVGNSASATSALLSSTYLPQVPAISAGGANINISPANVIGPTADMYTVFGGSTSFPNKIGNASLPNISGYDNWVLGDSIANVDHSHHSTTGGANGHAAALSGSYLGVFGGYGVVAGGTQNWVTADQGAVLGGRQNAVATAVTTLSVQANPADTTITTTVALVAGRTVYLASTGSQNAVEVFTVSSIAGLVSTLSGPVVFVHAVNGKVYSGDGTVTDGTVGGGQSNAVTKTQGTIGGGYNNKVQGTAGVVSGGTGNAANTTAAVVGGGDSNVASGTSAYGVIGGGQSNSVTASGATVPGGIGNTASGKFATAQGSQAIASLYGEVAQASGGISAIGDAQTSMVTIKADSGAIVTPIEMFLNVATSDRITLVDNTGLRFRAEILCWSRTSHTVVGSFKIEGACYRGTGAASTALFGTPVKTADAANLAGVDITCAADATNGALTFTLTGVAANRIYGTASVRLVKIIAA